jgi:hypothetical protein
MECEGLGSRLRDLESNSKINESIDIVTHKRNEFGHVIKFFDPDLMTYYVADDLIVTDNEGNVVIV